MDDVENKIKQWAKQMPDLNTTPMAVTARLQQVSKQINDELNTTFDKHKLNDAGFDVLSTLLRAGPPHSLSPKQLLKQMLITSGTMTTRIDKLEKEGFVKRKIKKNDKRSVSVAITKNGLNLIEEVIVEHVKAQEKVVSVLSTKEQKVFVELLHKMMVQTPSKNSSN